MIERMLKKGWVWVNRGRVYIRFISPMILIQNLRRNKTTIYLRPLRISWDFIPVFIWS